MITIVKRGKRYAAELRCQRRGKQKRRKISLRTTSRRVADRLATKIETYLSEHPNVDPYDTNIDLVELVNGLQPPNNGVATFRQAYQAFLNDRRKTGAKEETIKTYTNVFRRFLSWHAQDDMPLSLIDRSVIEAFLYRRPNGRALAQKTRHHSYRHLKALFNFCQAQGFVAQNPLEGIEIKKGKTEYDPKMPTHEDYLAILENHRKHVNSTKHIRDKQEWFGPALALLYWCGLRRKELVELKLQQVQRDCTLIYIGHSKREMERWIPLTPECREIMMPWHERRHKAGGKWLFPKWNTDIPITVDHLSRTFSKFRDRAGVRSTVVPHGFRHTRITIWVQDMGLSDAQSLAGHATTEMTKGIYTHLRRDYFDKIARRWNDL